jgi:hypothetical protein
MYVHIRDALALAEDMKNYLLLRSLIISLHDNSPRSSILHLTTSMVTTLERMGASDKTVWPSITGFKVDGSIECVVSPLFDSSDHWMCFSASQQDGRTIMANPSGTYGNEKAMVIIENIMKGIKKLANNRSS